MVTRSGTGTSRRRATGILAALLLAAGTAAVLTTTAPAAAGPPDTTYIQQQSDGLTMAWQGATGILHSWVSCGTEFTPEKPSAFSADVSMHPAAPVPAADLQQTYAPSSCDGTQPVGERVAAWNGRVFWLTADGHVVARRSTAYPGDGFDLEFWTTALPPLIGNGGTPPGLTVDDSGISWTQSSLTGGMTLYTRHPSTPGDTNFFGPVTTDLHVAGSLTQLTNGPYGLRFVIDTEPGTGSRLLALTPQPDGTYSQRVLSLNATVSALNSAWFTVYWAESNHGAYVIYSSAIGATAGSPTFTTPHPVSSSSGFDAGTRVTQIAVNPTNDPTGHDLYWVVQEPSGRPNDPALVRLRRSPSRVDTMLTQRNAGTIASLVADDQYLYWTDFDAIHRMAVTAVAPHIIDSPLTITDVSPDLPYLDGQSSDAAGSDTGGRVRAIVIDPRDNRVMIAATQFSGIWQSTDGGRNWHQSSSGLTAGSTEGGQKLAIDSHGDVLYATADEGLTESNPGPTSALWVSRNDGGAWGRVTQIPSVCPAGGVGAGHTLYIRAVTFTTRYAWASTNCGLYQSADFSNWTTVAGTDSPPATAPIIGSGSSLFACWGLFAYELTGTTWVKSQVSIGLLGGCTGENPLAPIANSSTTRQVVVLLGVSGATMDAEQVTMPARSADPPDLRELGFPELRTDASGDFGIWTVGSGTGVHLFGAKSNHFYEWSPPETWTQFSDTVHVDSQDIVFPSDFDPARGNCHSYLADDGGIHENTTVHRDGSPCTTGAGPWLRAQHGLHAFKSQAFTGVHRNECRDAGNFIVTPCPVLYEVSADNGTWERDQTIGEPDWEPLVGCCGDTGGAILDPTWPSRLELTRGTGTLYNYVATDSNDYVRPTNAAGHDVPPPPNYLDLDFPSSPSGAAMIKSTVGQLGVADDFAISVVPDAPNATTGYDQVMRQVHDGGWVPVGPRLPFDNSPQLAASGGHVTPVVWVRTGGKVLRGDFFGGGSSWVDVTPTDMTASLIWANPEDPYELWAEDSQQQTIRRSSENPTASQRPTRPVVWTTAADLTGYARGYDPSTGNYAYRVGRTEIQDGRFNTLNHMWFPNGTTSPMRVAALVPAGAAVSHDSGDTWIPLADALPWHQWLAHTWATWFDPGAEMNGALSDLYLGLDGRGLIRVTGPWESLIDVNYQYCGRAGCGAIMSATPRTASAPAPATKIPPGTPKTVTVVDDLTGRKIPMTRGTDGHWRADELVDGQGIGTIHYHFVVNGIPGPRQTHSITPAERHGGIVGVAPAGPGPSTSAPSIAPMSVSSPVAFTEACPGTDPVEHVSATITTTSGAPVTTATLAVGMQSTDEHGDAQLAPLARVPMTRDVAAGSQWSADLDTVALHANVDGDATGGLTLQIAAVASGGSATSEERILLFSPCQPTGGTVPSAPLKLSAQAGARSATLLWAPPSSDGGSDITGYELTPYLEGVAQPVRYWGPGTHSATVPDLDPGKPYTFTVQALNIYGAGPPAGPTDPVTPTG